MPRTKNNNGRLKLGEDTRLLIKITDLIKNSDPRSFSIRNLRKMLVDDSSGHYVPSYATLR